MAFTQQQLDTLDAAIAQGALTVKYGDKEVTYRSLNDMIRTRNMMAQALGIQKPYEGRHYAQFSKGYKPSNHRR
jgi:hypothetical protein